MNKQILKLLIKNIAWLFALAIFFMLDRFLKLLALNSSERILIPNLLNFNFVPNYNIAFSLPVSGWYLNVIITLIIGAIIYFWATNYNRLTTIESISFFGILLGAISNLLDRFQYGFVIDYLDLRWFTIFNFADVLISCCSLVLLLSLIKKDSK
jgi:signal peptidase II